MPDQYDNEKRFVLFQNESDNEKAPHFKGTIQIDGVNYNIAAWKAVSKSGEKKYLRGIAELPKDAPKSKPKAAPAKEDDIPW